MDISWKQAPTTLVVREGEKPAAILQAAGDRKADILRDTFQSFKKDADETCFYYQGYPDRRHCLKGDER